MVRSALGTLLDLEADIDAVARVADGEAACCGLWADLPVIDIDIPQFSSLKMARRIERQQLPVRVSMVTALHGSGAAGASEGDTTIPCGFALGARLVVCA